MTGMSERIDHFFHISERGSTVGREVRGGLITFLAMFYIMAVNPLILQQAAGPELFGQLVTATGLAAFISCILMGIYAKFPVALAPGMGINAFIAYTIVIGMGFTYYQALLVVLMSGIIFLALTVSGIRTKILSSIPAIIRLAITAGIGFFIVLVGLYNSGIIIHADGSALTLGDIASPGVNLSIMCIIITLVLWYRDRWYAVLVGVIFSVAFGFMGGQLFGWDTTVDGASLIPGVGTAAVTGIVSMPDFGLFGAMFTEFTMFDTALIPAFLASIASLLIVDMFDTAGTLLGIGQTAGIIDDDGNIEGSEKALQADAVSSIIGAVAGTTTTTSFIESSTGISAGARTGLMAVTVGIMFFLALFFVPVFSIITSACTVGALFLVGLMMITAVKDIEWTEPVNVATAFLTVFMMALSGSITDGIAFGILAYLLGMLVTKRIKEVPMMMWILGLIFLGYFYLTYGIIPDL